MIRNSRFLHFLVGFGLVALVVVAGFSLFSALIPTWGSTADEISREMPGDNLVPSPDVVWNHAITIQAPPEKIWPWIAQIGDTRGGYYSFTFIENIFAGYNLYHNASKIHPEWQNPLPGQGMIADYLTIQDSQTEKWLLAKSTDKMKEYIQWTWIWALYPVDSNTTRLVVRHHIQLNMGGNSSAIGSAVMLTGYVMERRMVLGIKERAEGYIEPEYTEWLEIFLWLAALAAGVTAAVLYLGHGNWRLPLVLGLTSIISLFLITYIQPPIWLRGVIDAALWTCAILIINNRKASKNEILRPGR